MALMGVCWDHGFYFFYWLFICVQHERNLGLFFLFSRGARSGGGPEFTVIIQ